MATHTGDQLQHAGEVVAAAVRAATARGETAGPAAPTVVDQAVACGRRLAWRGWRTAPRNSASSGR
jgi:hypothetical protein